ncbi:hypothetical protein CYMTET_47467 [Cymbomonas tetramitiformis]|uniref:Uncharacterized protein n=1 Tax=Cymbomonas tetramitiformis TaxID=36881 RepID=A0AAE0BVI7_9CHLO|nr:hypothetical protein CYMTET_47467 [Cymbomonas tetramitiformis]
MPQPCCAHCERKAWLRARFNRDLQDLQQSFANNFEGYPDHERFLARDGFIRTETLRAEATLLDIWKSQYKTGSQMEPCSPVVDEIILAYLFSTGKVATESKTDRQEQQRAERRAQRAIRVSQHFTELEGEEGAASGQPEAQVLVQPEAQAPAQLQAQAQEPLVIFEEDMEYTDSARVNLGTLPNYTGTKEEDRPKFLREFADMCENFVRQHNANVRRRLRSGAGTLTEAQMKTLNETPPDFEYLWDIIPACLAGENSQALSWWRENYERGGVVASNMDRVLKDTSEHGPLEGTIGKRYLTRSGN